MSYFLFAIYEAEPQVSTELAAAIEDNARTFLAGHNQILNADLFVPDQEEALFFEDGPAPALMLQIEAADVETLETLVASLQFKPLFLETPLNLTPEVRPSFGIFEAVGVPVLGQKDVSPRTAPMSFVVRYYGPMPDQNAFQAFYVANHLPMLAKFPAIRNAYAFLPVSWQNPGLPQCEILLGNEVVFDNVKALNEAMQSDVIAELRKDSRQFPPFGHSTHHTMQRISLVAKH